MCKYKWRVINTVGGMLVQFGLEAGECPGEYHTEKFTKQFYKSMFNFKKQIFGCLFLITLD